ncbi:hypothetical protein [Marinomonas sp. 2405UD68-3]|uniref:hypothetical protein n=1 Tax=Marinomonas sp. 2405UD68-3 TaxID=3391835 RepID=UPI0039C9F993
MSTSILKWVLIVIIAAIFHSIGLYNIKNNDWLSHIFVPNIPKKNQSIHVELHYKRLADVDASTRLPDQQTAPAKTLPVAASLTKNAQLTQGQPKSRNLQTPSTTTSVKHAPIKNTDLKETSNSTNSQTIEKNKTHNGSLLTNNKQEKNHSDKNPLLNQEKPLQATIDDELSDATPITKNTLSDTFDIINQDLLTTPLSASEDNDFEDVFSPAFKAALAEAVQEQQKYLNGYIKDDGYQITKDSDGTRYVNIKGICWKIPPEGESGEWFIVPAGCNNQEDTFHFEFGFTPEMLNPNSPFSRLLGLELDPNQ